MSRKQKTLFLGGIAKDYAEEHIKCEFNRLGSVLSEVISFQPIITDPCNRLLDGDKDQWKDTAQIEIVNIQKKPYVLWFTLLYK